MVLAWRVTSWIETNSSEEEKKTNKRCLYFSDPTKLAFVAKRIIRKWFLLCWRIKCNTSKVNKFCARLCFFFVQGTVAAFETEIYLIMIQRMENRECYWNSKQVYRKMIPLNTIHIMHPRMIESTSIPFTLEARIGLKIVRQMN